MYSELLVILSDWPWQPATPGSRVQQGATSPFSLQLGIAVFAVVAPFVAF